jgi:outer membrane cobalamin receptor
VPAPGAVPVLCALLLPLPLNAQHPPIVEGRVVEAGSGSPIEGAWVRSLEGGLEARTEGDGSFRLRGLPPGLPALRIARLGYRDTTVVVRAANGRVSGLTVTLTPTPIALRQLRVEVAGADLPAGALAVDREAIVRSGARDLGDVIRSLPGVSVVRRGGPGSPASVSIRGSGSGQVLVLVDGVPLNSPLTGEADLSSVSPGIVERVVVLPGSRSSRYGPRALAGAVLVETRAPRGPEASLRLQGGSQVYVSTGATLGFGSGSDEGWSALASGEWRRSDGDFPFTSPAVRGGGETRRQNADHSLGTGHLSVRYRRPLFDVSARTEFSSIERGMPGSVVQPSPHARQSQTRGSVAVLGRAGGERVGSRLTLDLSWHQAAYRDTAPTGAPAFDEEVDATGIGAMWKGFLGLGPARLEAGVEARRLNVTASSLSDDAPTAQTSVGTWLSTTARAAPGAWRLQATPSVRLDHHSLAGGAVLSPRLDLSAGRGPFTGRVALASGFSPPSLADLFFQEGVLVEPNPGLRPERVRGEVEAGVDARFAPGRTELDLGFRGFRADVDDMILWSPDFRFVWSPANVDVSRHGWEAVAGLRVPALRTRVSGSVSRVAVEYRGSVPEGQVVYRPSLTANVDLTAVVAGFELGASLRYIGERRTVAGSPLNALDPYAVVDFGVARTLSLGTWAAVVRLSIDDLLDEQAEYLVDFPSAGRLWFLGVELSPAGLRP